MQYLPHEGLAGDCAKVGVIDALIPTMATIEAASDCCIIDDDVFMNCIPMAHVPCLATGFGLISHHRDADVVGFLVSE